MKTSHRHDSFDAGASYDYYMGRWSREIATEFVAWLAPPPGLRWLDVGCGTGALTQTVLSHADPASVHGVDPSDGFIAHARETVSDSRTRFDVAGAGALPCADGSVDIVVSALAYNFFPDRERALAEFLRVVKPGGTVGFYVWDYPGGGMGFIRAFWRAATAEDAAAGELTEENRFPFCTRDALLREVTTAGLRDAMVEPIEKTTRFQDFDAFWHPFTLGAGPAPGYCQSLAPDAREALRRRLMQDLDAGAGPVELPARAWAVKAMVR